MPTSRSRAKFRILKKNGKFYWKLQVRGESIAQSTKSYSSARNAKQAIEAFQRNATDAAIEDNGQ